MSKLVSFTLFCVIAILASPGIVHADRITPQVNASSVAEFTFITSPAVVAKASVPAMPEPDQPTEIERCGDGIAPVLHPQSSGPQVQFAVLIAFSLDPSPPRRASVHRTRPAATDRPATFLNIPIAQAGKHCWFG